MKNIFINKSIQEIHQGYRDKSIDPVDVAKTCVDTIERFENKYQAWVCFDKKRLLKEASNVRDRILGGHEIRTLEGIPVGVKDVFNTADFPTQMGSALWKDFTPGNDARVVYYIKEAGGIIFGKTVTAEFAVHALDKTRNPHDITKTPGTSSSGSVAAVALRQVPVSLGTQTAGSIIRPASFCGVYGCKPSFGLIPRTGILKTTDTLDSVGFFAARFDNLKTMFDAITVRGNDYPVSYNALNDTARQTKWKKRPWRVALVRTHTWNKARDYAKNALTEWANVLSKDNEIELIEKELPQDMERAHDVHTVIYDKTLSYYFSQEFKEPHMISPIMNELIQRGNKISREKFYEALDSQARLAMLMDDFFKNFDSIITLSTTSEAPARNETELPDSSLMWNLTYLPVISAPVFVSPNGLPFGAQLVGRRYNDLLLFNFASYLRGKGFIPEGNNPLCNDAGAVSAIATGRTRINKDIGGVLK